MKTIAHAMIDTFWPVDNDPDHPSPLGQYGSMPERRLECAPDGGQFAGWELTGAAGLSEDESHGQAPHP